MPFEKRQKYIADFETVVYDGQQSTEVWAGAWTKWGNIDATRVHVENNIAAFFDYAEQFEGDYFFHNLKFDGSFIVSELLRRGFDFIPKAFPDELKPQQFTAHINAKGQWFSLSWRVGEKVVICRDSFKLLPFSVAQIAKNFCVIWDAKDEIEYTGERHAGGEITPHEREYIKKDVLIVSEAFYNLESEFGEIKKQTIGGECMREFREGFHPWWWAEFFPAIDSFDGLEAGENCEQFIRKSYRGAWCYVDKRHKGQEVGAGRVYDANGLYSSVMHSQSGNRYPVGEPYFGKGKPPAWLENDPNTYIFYRIQCEFELKMNKLPTVQIKKDWRYNPREWLTTSRVYNSNTGKCCRSYLNMEGDEEIAAPVLTLTQTDYKLLREHYNIYNIKYIGYCYFNTEIGLFDRYIDHWQAIKQNSKGARRQMAKLKLNNLYGKFAQSSDSSYKIPSLADDGRVIYSVVMESERKPAYIPIGAAITAYAREYTIRAAQKNYNRFCYADTDSLHLIGNAPPVGVVVDDGALGAVKLESTFSTAKFIRAKTYCEVDTDGMPHFTVAGCPTRSKNILVDRWRRGEMCLRDFDVGLTVGGKLVPRQIPGGTVLTETDFTIL